MSRHRLGRGDPALQVEDSLPRGQQLLHVYGGGCTSTQVRLAPEPVGQQLSCLGDQPARSVNDTQWERPGKCSHTCTTHTPINTQHTHTYAHTNTPHTYTHNKYQSMYKHMNRYR